jgi:lipopolysaccharide/colanic/teichoic acid biosynthesis glycosyltransferase
MLTWWSEVAGPRPEDPQAAKQYDAAYAAIARMASRPGLVKYR